MFCTTEVNVPYEWQRALAADWLLRDAPCEVKGHDSGGLSESSTWVLPQGVGLRLTRLAEVQRPLRRHEWSLMTFLLDKLQSWSSGPTDPDSWEFGWSSSSQTTFGHFSNKTIEKAEVAPRHWIVPTFYIRNSTNTSKYTYLFFLYSKCKIN